MTEDRYPGYDVLAKRHSPSWNEQTRLVVDRRVATPDEPHFFTTREWQTMRAVCDRVMPQPAGRPRIPLAALVDRKMREEHADGYRHARMPRQDEAWRRGLAALDGDAEAAHGGRFHELDAATQDALLRKMQDGELSAPGWGGMPSEMFFSQRVVPDIANAYYSHPTAWNEIGFGGPASPRGYVRLGADQRDPWEAAEAKPGREADAERRNRNAVR